MAIGTVFYIISLILFGQVTPDKINLIIPATLAFSLYISFYWMIRHWFLSMNTDYRQIGKQISVLTIIRIIISFIAPIVGGWLSYFVSFNVAFLLGASAGFLSLIPIILFHAPPHPMQYGLKTVISTLKKPELKNIRPAYFWEGFSAFFIKDAWILAFIIFIGTILDLGLLIGFTTLITALMTWTAGVWFDQRKRKSILTYMTNIKALSVFLYSSIFFFPHIFYVYFVELFNRLIYTMHQNVVDSYLYAYSSKIHPVQFNLNREVHLNIGRFVSSGILVIAFYFLPAEFLWVAIGLGAFMTFRWLTLKRSDYLLH